MTLTKIGIRQIRVAFLHTFCMPIIKKPQAFRFMVGPGHCPMISKYGPSLSKAVGPVDPSFLVVNKSHFNKKNIHLTNPTKPKKYIGSQYSKTCLKQPLKKTKQRSFKITNGSLMKVKSIAECSPWSILQYY